MQQLNDLASQPPGREAVLGGAGGSSTLAGGWI